MTLDELRRSAAKRHGIPELLDQVRGDTPAEIEAFAAAAAALRQQQEKNAPQAPFGSAAADLESEDGS